MDWIMLRIKNGIVEYQEAEDELAVDEENEMVAIMLSKWKQAGREDHPLTYKFIKELLKND
jgi:hypothetical protein